MSSTFKVQLMSIDRIEEHPNADRLEIAHLKGWQCIVRKGQYKPGDLVVYIPIDSIIPLELEEKIFGPDSKVKLNKHRVKTIKLRKVISQGLVVDLETCGITKAEEGLDVTKELGIKKYEPPAPRYQQSKGVPKRRHKNPNFKEYSSFENYKYYVDLFKPDDEVVITEKIHGTNFRAGWVPFHDNNLWRKLLKWTGLAPKWVFVYGSHRVQISEKPNYDGFYDQNVYAEAVVKYDLKKRIPKGLVVYGEIYGAGIQKNYDYGHKKDRGLVIFDIMDSQELKYQDWCDFRMWIRIMGLPTPPVLFEGKYGDCDIEKLIDGPSVLAPEQKVREGCVVKMQEEHQSIIGRKALKVINPEYLLKDTTEYH